MPVYQLDYQEPTLRQATGTNQWEVIYEQKTQRFFAARSRDARIFAKGVLSSLLVTNPDTNSKHLCAFIGLFSLKDIPYSSKIRV